MKYLSLLKGINVSGQKKIKMADLKQLYVSLNYKNVVTYLQTGNVIFDSDDENIKIKEDIENEIEKKYKFNVEVIIISDKDFKAIIQKFPFGEINLETEGTQVLASFLNHLPSDADIQKLNEYVIPPEKLIIKDKTVFLRCPNGYGKSKLSNHFIEQKLKVTATTRNWKTVMKLKAMLHS